MSSTSNHLAPSEARQAAPSILRSPAQRFAAFWRRLWAAYWAFHMRRATVRMLQMLDDRTLKDIGLTRSEVSSGRIWETAPIAPNMGHTARMATLTFALSPIAKS